MKVNHYKNGFEIRLKNKKINFIEEEGKVLIDFLFATDDAEDPACFHKCLKGKVRNTQIAISDEVMEALSYFYLHFKKRRQKNI